jgi:hypothetical protein
MKYLLLSLLICAFASESVFAIPPSKITGTVCDSKTGERLTGVIIRLEGMSRGAKTNVDGEFSITAEAGTYTLRLSYLGYKEKRIENATVAAGQTKRVDIVLDQAALQGEEVVVTTKVESETQTAQLLARKSASSMNDFISAEQIRRSPDATSGDALKRVSGVTIVDNKFVEIRGTSDRYNNATLNGAALASTEPDKKSFSFDLLPANLIDNTVVSKTFTPDMPGNFSGGLVQVNTVNFPDKFNAQLSIGGGYNSATTGSNMVSYQTGGTDWLASDDGTRALPDGFPASNINRAKLSPLELQQYSLLFPNTWGTKDIKASTSLSIAASIGDGISLFDESELGYIASLSYKSNSERIEIDRNGYNPDGTASFLRSGTNNIRSVLLGGLANITYKFGSENLISFRNIYDRSAEDQVLLLSGVDSANGFYDQQSSLHYTERTLYTGQVNGEHLIGDLGELKTQWRLSHTATTRDEPDLRRLVYSRVIDAPDVVPYNAALSASADPKTGGRFFSTMSEKYDEGALDLTKTVGASTIRLGGLLGSRARDFSARVLAFKLADASQYNLLFSSIDTLFAPNHIGPNGFQIDEITNPSDHYTAAEHLLSGYAMIELPLMIGDAQFKVIAGGRVESDRQSLNSANSTGGPLNYDMKHTDLLPSISIIYSVNEKMNVRLAATQTVSRPEFREIAPFAFYDFEIASVIQGNDTLDRALIRNLDFRYEYYPTAGELISVSLFHKRFVGAIEATDQGSNNVKSWANARTPAINYGVELEVRKSLGFLGSNFDYFTIGGNYSYIISKVNVHELTGGQQEERPMQGQSPYSLNLGLEYANIGSGTAVNLLYNTYGKRIAEVNPYSGDLYELPRNVIDVSVSQKLFDRYELKYTAKDMLAEPQEFRSNDAIERRNRRGSVHSLSFTIRL